MALPWFEIERCTFLFSALYEAICGVASELREDCVRREQ